MKNQMGITIIELLIVIAIVGILASVAYPSYQDSIKTGNRSECMGIVLELAQFIERSQTENMTYAGIDTSDYTQCPLQGDALYNIAVSDTSRTYYKITATPTSGGVMKDDGALTIDANGVKTWGTKSCWSDDC